MYHYVYEITAHLIKRQTIEDFVRRNARSKTSFEDWLEKLKQSDWEQSGDIKGTYKMPLVKSRSTSLYAGLVRMPRTTSCVLCMNNIR